MITRKKRAVNFVLINFSLAWFYTGLLKIVSLFINLYICHRHIKVSRVWVRNAVALGYAEPGISDLDLTVFLKSPLDEAEALKLRKCLIFIKKVFPMTGDYTAISTLPFDLQLIQNHQNYYELSRDPELKALVNEKNTPITPAEKLVFFHKMLLSNFVDIEMFPELRIKKWSHHFNLLGIQIDEQLAADNLSKHIWAQYTNMVNSVLNLSISVSVIQALVKKLVHNNQSLHLNFDQDCPEWFYILNFNQLCFFQKDLSRLSESQHQVLLKVVEWEVIGLKYNFALTYIDYSSHADNLQKALSRVCETQQTPYKAIMKFLVPMPEGV